MDIILVNYSNSTVLGIRFILPDNYEDRHNMRHIDQEISKMKELWNKLWLEDNYSSISHISGGKWDLGEFEIVGSRFVERIISRLQDFGSSSFEESSILEIGCGVGRFLKPLSLRFKKVIGVDISEEMLRAAKEYLKANNITLILGNGKSLERIESNTIDYCISAGVFQHITHIDCILNYIKEALRVLKLDGLFLFQFQGAKVQEVGLGTRGAKILAKVLTKELKYCPYQICEISQDSKVPYEDIIIVLRKTSIRNPEERSFWDFPIIDRQWGSGVYSPDLKTFTGQHNNLLKKPKRVTFYD